MHGSRINSMLFCGRGGEWNVWGWGGTPWRRMTTGGGEKWTSQRFCWGSNHVCCLIYNSRSSYGQRANWWWVSFCKGNTLNLHLSTLLARAFCVWGNCIQVLLCPGENGLVAVVFICFERKCPGPQTIPWCFHQFIAAFLSKFLRQVFPGSLPSKNSKEKSLRETFLDIFATDNDQALLGYFLSKSTVSAPWIRRC